MDLNGGRIAIRHTLVMVDGKPAMAEPKTAKGRRSLTLAPEVLDALRGYRAHQAAERLSWGAPYTDSGPGHATISLTLDTYSHVIPSLRQEAANVMAAAVLDPAATAPQPGPEGQVRAITSGS